MTSAIKRAVLDGSTLEGGGQILRNATALAALLSTRVEISNVRENRPQPGLKAQHASGLRLVADICGASAEGLDKGARTVSFDPGPVRAGEYTADPGTAGSTALLLQIALPCLLFPERPSPESESESESESKFEAPGASTLTLRGGTDAPYAPPADYARAVLLPFLHRHFALPRELLTLAVVRRGFTPHGGGELRVRVPGLSAGAALPPVALTARGAVALTARGAVAALRGRAYVAGPHPRRTAEQMRDAALAELAHLAAPTAPPTVSIDVLADERGQNHRPGSGIVLWAETSTGCILGGSALGSKNASAAETGRAAAAELLRNLEHGGCVDEYMQDQMIIFLALAKGKSSVKTGPLTLHTRQASTAIWVAETLTDAKFQVSELQEDGGQMLISCDGIGFEGRL
ncbi:RNA 3'-terminal phosphate cyclase [Phellopilus nigrolimitatus]|nr:RNA 3'-terminal phosphate cyclase [Phellopilus nigrolimitatus]